MSLKLASDLFEEGEYDEALRVCNDLLNETPDEPRILFLMGHIFIKAERWGLAYQLYKRVTEISPKVSEGWNNLGRCCQELNRFQEAERCFKRCMDLKPGDFAAYNNMLLMAANQCRPQEALDWAEKAKAAATNEEQRRDAEENAALAHLSIGQWAEGWAGYECGLGKKFRRIRCFNGEPRWDGSDGKTVVIYGEQGIGDEVMFASMIPDAKQHCSPIIECDPRLVGLFKRSFDCPVYGTRFKGAVAWPLDHKIDATCAMGSLGGLYRAKGEFPRKPYLIPDPERRLQWRALLDTLPGRKIGLAWTGGKANTRTRDRSLTLQQLKPLLDTGHSFISLQYKDAPEAAEHGIRHWKRAVQSDDYDDTAALVAELDCVVSVTTAVALLCGALGKECHVLVPPQPTWHWGNSGDMPWHDIKLYRSKGDWRPVVEEVRDGIGDRNIQRAADSRRSDKWHASTALSGLPGPAGARPGHPGDGPRSAAGR